MRRVRTMFIVRRRLVNMLEVLITPPSLTVDLLIAIRDLRMRGKELRS